MAKKIKLLVFFLFISSISFAQFKQGTLMFSGDLLFENITNHRFRDQNNHLYNLDVGFFLYKNFAIGGQFSKDIEYSNSDYPFSLKNYTLFLRSNFLLKTGLYAFIKPYINKETYSRYGYLENKQTVGIQLGLTAFLTRFMAIEVVPVNAYYSYIKHNSENGYNSIKDEKSEVGLSLFQNTSLFSMKFFMFTDEYHTNGKPQDLTNRKIWSGSFLYNHRQNQNKKYNATQISFVPSVMVFISNKISGGLNFGFNYSLNDHLIDDNSIYYTQNSKMTNFEFLLGPSFRYNYWLNNQTAVFAGPYGTFGFGSENVVSTGIKEKYLNYRMEGGVRLGISTFISPRVALETYTSVVSFNKQYNFDEELNFTGQSGTISQSGFTFSNLYLSIGWLVGKAD